MILSPGVFADRSLKRRRLGTHRGGEACLSQAFRLCPAGPGIEVGKEVGRRSGPGSFAGCELYKVP